MNYQQKERERDSSQKEKVLMQSGNAFLDVRMSYMYIHMQVIETRTSGKVKVIEFMKKQGQYHYLIYHDKVWDFYFDSFLMSEIIMNLIIVLIAIK